MSALRVVRADPDVELAELDRAVDLADEQQVSAFRAATLARWEFGRRVEVGNALQTYGSWRELVKSFAEPKGDPQAEPAEAPPGWLTSLCRFPAES